MQRLKPLMVLAAVLGTPVVLSAQDGDSGYRGEGVRILMGRSLAIPANGVQRDPVVVIGGSLTVDGRVEDDVVVIAGRTRLGPAAVLLGDLTTIGGSADLDPEARIHGELNQVSGMLPVLGLEFPFDTWWWAMAALVLTSMRFVFTLVVAALVMLMAPRWARDGAYEVGNAAGASLLTGWAVQLLFVPAVVAVTAALALSVIGIPLVAAVPLLFVALALVWVAGFAAVAAQVGRAVRRRRPDVSDPSPLDATLGVTLVGSVTLAGHLLAMGAAWMMPAALVTIATGLVIEYLAWTVGLGAATRIVFSRWRGVPPLPQATLQPAQ